MSSKPTGSPEPSEGMFLRPLHLWKNLSPSFWGNGSTKRDYLHRQRLNLSHLSFLSQPNIILKWKMSDFRSGLLGEWMLHRDVSLPYVLAGIHWDSLSMSLRTLPPEVTWPSHFSSPPFHPHLHQQDCYCISPNRPPHSCICPLWSSFLRAATMNLDEPKSPLGWFPALLVESLTWTTKSCLCLCLQPHLPLLPHAPCSAEKPGSFRFFEMPASSPPFSLCPCCSLCLACFPAPSHFHSSFRLY